MDYTKTDATWEILLMILVAFILGYLLRFFWEKMTGHDMYDHHKVTDFMEEDFDESDFLDDTVVEEEEVSSAKVVGKEDLKLIEGIGPKIEELLNNGGIENFHELANTSTDRLSQILTDGGERFKLHDPSTWPAQAELAYYGKWDELKEYQEFLSGGKELG